MGKTGRNVEDSSRKKMDGWMDGKLNEKRVKERR